MGFEITCNGNPGEILGNGMSYIDYLGTDYASFQQVAFATFEVVEGENTIVLTTNNVTYRPCVDTTQPIYLVY